MARPLPVGVPVRERGSLIAWYVALLFFASLALYPTVLSAQRDTRSRKQQAPPRANGGGQGEQQRNQNPGPPPRNNNNGNAQGARNQEHLTEWMNRHRDLPIEEQQRALMAEPGFRELPAQTQKSYLDRLAQLNQMKPEERTRILERNEVMERLSVPQRQQVRGALLQLGSLPEDRRRAVSRAFRDLRTMPENQRQQYLNSPAYRSQFNDQERNTVGNLMAIEPYGVFRAVPGPQQ